MINTAKKRGIALVLAVICILAALPIVAAKIRENEIEKTDAQTQQITEISIIDENLSLKNESFSKIVSAIKEKHAVDQAFYSEIYSYAEIVRVYQPTRQDLAYLQELILQGYQPSRLKQAYEFWIDTDREVEFIQTLYDGYKEEYEGSRHWVEAVFNQVTESKYGVLDREGIESYMGKGASIEDISVANRLSRKGVYTIHEILEKRLSGISWIEVISDIYAYTQRHGKPVFEIGKIEEYKTIMSGNEILTAIFLSQRECKNIDEYMQILVNGEKLSGRINDYINKRMEGIQKQLLVQSVWDESQDVRDKNNNARKDLEKQILSHGISSKKLNELKIKGYNELDILNAAEISKKNKRTVEQVLSGIDKGLTWSELAEGKVDVE